MYYESFAMREILKKYKWANGYTEAKINKVQKLLGDGTYYGMCWILLGWGLPAVGIVYLIAFLNNWNPNMTNVIAWLFVYFGFGLGLELYCSVCRDKVLYNNEVCNNAQLNLFRDFGVSLK